MLVNLVSFPIEFGELRRRYTHVCAKLPQRNQVSGNAAGQSGADYAQEFTYYSIPKFLEILAIIFRSLPIILTYFTAQVTSTVIENAFFSALNGSCQLGSRLVCINNGHSQARVM